MKDMQSSFREESLVVKRAIFLFLSVSVLSGCAGNRAAAPAPGDYVEVDNPGYTMSPGAPPTIWVPRSYVESGIPRGKELVSKGIEELRGTPSGHPDQQVAQQQPSAPVPQQQAVPQQQSAQQRQQVPQQQPVPQRQPVAVSAKAPAVPSVRHRIFVVEVGKNSLLPRFSDAMKKADAGTMLDPAQAALVARYASVATPADRSALSLKLQEDFNANLVVFVAAPDGTSPGSTLTADIYEAQGGSLVKSVEATIGMYPGTDSAVREAAVSSALQRLAAEVKNVAALVPWYGKVVAVDGERVYISAGKESGLEVGQVMYLYRSGRVVEKLGFAPGQRIGRLEITGFVGTDGSFSKIREGGKAQVSDLVGFE
jgi:hypothetical protein